MNGREVVIGPRCRLSAPTHPHSLIRQANPRPSKCFSCGPLGESDEDNWHYYCQICKLVFHEDCDIVPLRLRHPCHPNHILYTTIRFSETDIFSFQNHSPVLVYSIAAMVDRNLVFESLNACDWCGKDLGPTFYRCVDCEFRLDFDCVSDDPPFMITNSENHQHPLTLVLKPT